MMTGAETVSEFAVGDRVELVRLVDRLPDFLVEAGKTGTVTCANEREVYVQMDDKIDGAEEWDNQIIWDLVNCDWEIPGDDLRKIA